MSPSLSALLRSWDLRAEIIVALAIAGITYSLGWKRLRDARSSQKSRARHNRLDRFLAAPWRLVSYLSGISLLTLALLSPIDVLGGHLFFMHMIQHLLLIMIIPPLLLIANPLPFILWGLPVQARISMSRWLSKGASFRKTLRILTRPGRVWILCVTLLIGWHDPSAYNAALRSEIMHDLEHATFFGSAMLFWWHVTGAGPRIHGRFTNKMRIGYLIAMLPPNMLAGVTIAFATQPLYNYYVSVPRLWGMTVMQDQMLGGLIMWIPGSMMYIIALLVIILGLLSENKKRVSLSNSAWTSEHAATLPGHQA